MRPNLALRSKVIHLLNKHDASIRGHVFLGKLTSHPLPFDGLQAYLEQRYLASLHFEELLRAGIAKASRAAALNRTSNPALYRAYSRLAANLQQNLDEETGKDTKGISYRNEPHELWRRDFYREFRLNSDHLDHARSSTSAHFDGTREYSAELSRLCKSDAVTIAAALGLLEKSLPGEFNQLASGLVRSKEVHSGDSRIPDIFDVSSGRVEVKPGKETAGVYLRDHIHHDPRHYAEILEPLQAIVEATPREQRDAMLKKVNLGASRLKRAKTAFHDSLHARLYER